MTRQPSSGVLANIRGHQALARLGSRELSLAVINVAIFAFLSVIRPTAFASWTNIKAVLSLMTYDLLLAVAMTTVLIVRGIDLSIGSIFALSSVVMAMFLREGEPAVVALALGLGTSLACGLINGLLIARARILPFLATLGMMSVARGLATVLSTGQYISFPNAAPWLTTFGRFELHLQISGQRYTLPMPFLAVVGTIFVYAVLLERWVPLRRAFYVGESPAAAWLSGMRVVYITMFAYLISAFWVWIASVLIISANRIGYANYGVGAELRALAAAVVGGGSLQGGVGSIFGTFLGVLMLALIGNGFVILNGNPDWQQATLGLVLIAAIGFDTLRTYRRRR